MILSSSVARRGAEDIARAARERTDGMVMVQAPAFGTLLRRARRSAGLTQEELAERAGLSVRGISDLERGLKHRPHRDTVQLLADALQLTGEDRSAFEAAGRLVPSTAQAKPIQTHESELPLTDAGPSTQVRIFLIADIRGYTAFTQERGDEAAARLSERFAELVVQVVEPRGGRLVELRGDEALVAFDSARQALRCALAMQDRFVREADDVLPLRVGMGLDAGEAVEVGIGFRGGALNLAARLCSLAGAGEVFASEAACHLAGQTEGLVAVDRGVVHFKGLPNPIRVLQIARDGELPAQLAALEPPLITHPTNLPDEPTSFIGREREIDQIAGLVQHPSIRMVTLTGPGGTGKTRLALQVGATLLPDFRHGVFFVSLASLADPALVSSAIAEVLGIREAAERSLHDSLVEHLKAKHLLLVLDNFEHLVGASPIVSSLLDSCRELHILTTSRIPLHLTREHEYAVPPLAVPDLDHLPNLEALSRSEAVALFVDRAMAVKADFQLTNDNAPAVVEICHRLDGLPLAIELAATRSKLFPPAALLQRLSRRLNLLTGGAKDRAARQQTLRNTMDWSHSLLSGDEQALFARLSVFVGGCTFEGAEAVCNPEESLDPLEGLASLVDKSLLRQVGEEAPRFSMLETVREFAADKLDEREEGEAIRVAHAGHYLQVAEEAEPELTGREQGDWLARLDEELDNLRAALGWFLDRGSIEEELRLAGALYWYWRARGSWSEGRRWLEEGLAQGERTVPAVRAKALWALGYMAAMQGDTGRARLPAEEALSLYRVLQDQRGCARALMGLGLVAWRQGQYERATALHEEALRLSNDLGDRRESAWMFFALGVVAWYQGDVGRAKERYEEALAISRTIGDTYTTAYALAMLGQVALVQDDLAGAEILCAEGLALARGMGLKLVIAYAARGLGRVARKQGQLERAGERLRESLLLAREQGERPLSLYQLGELASLAVVSGEAQRAARLKGAETALRDRLGIPLPPVFQATEEETLAQAKAMLGKEGFARAWEQGRAMNLERAVAYALGERA